MTRGLGGEEKMLGSFDRAAMSESVARNILSKIHPTTSSEQRRRGVVLYVQNLIRRYLRCEVFPYGSVPLKTYLPDGDIDLTAFVAPNLEEALANDVVSVLQTEEHNSAAEFIVKDVQLIRAEVKIVKCIVQNIVVDISFNQLGGICTLCFLEQVNRLIGKDHLFKRSIILVKTWCYYESRILGAHHALLSTYALETLVLYIIHLFHSNLDGPLAVLYTFLNYFSKFDWDNYCVGLNGPVHISSLPEIVDERRGNVNGHLLLTDEFLKDCVNTFSVPSRGVDKNSRTFSPKFLNIIDPLKGNNNLGRSVSKGNLFRIQSAFTYGARKLGQALSQEEDSLAEELSKFFLNTLNRHGNGQRPDVQDLYGDGSSMTQKSGITENKDEIGCSTETANNSKLLTEKDGCITSGSLADIEYRLSGDAEDLASSKLHSLKIANKTSEDKLVIPHFAPHLYFSGFKANENSGEKCSSNEMNSLCDLNGDYESHFKSLKYGRFCYDRSSAPLPPPMPSQWNVIRHALPFKRNGFPNMPRNNVGMIPRPVFYPNNPAVLVRPPAPASFGVEDFPKQRGTGTYIPNLNRPPYRNHLMGRGGWKEQGPMTRSHNSPRSTPWAPFRMFDDTAVIDGLNVNPRRHEDRPEVNSVPHQNSSTGGQQHAPSTQNLPPPPPPCAPKAAPSKDARRLLKEMSVYRLKNEDDFPPL